MKCCFGIKSPVQHTEMTEQRPDRSISQFVKKAHWLRSPGSDDIHLTRPVKQAACPPPFCVRDEYCCIPPGRCRPQDRCRCPPGINAAGHPGCNTIYGLVHHWHSGAWEEGHDRREGFPPETVCAKVQSCSLKAYSSYEAYGHHFPPDSR